MVECSCCGLGCLEIKNPHKLKDLSIKDFVADGSTFLFENENGKIVLDPNDGYSYQVQTQLLITGLDYCDFFVNLSKESVCVRIEPDESLFDIIIQKSSSFFQTALLPELLAKFYSQPVPTNQEDEASDVWCYCRLGEDEDDMILCDNNDCEIKWFHTKCIRLKKVPKGKWFCPECRKMGKGKKPSKK